MADAHSLFLPFKDLSAEELDAVVKEPTKEAARARLAKAIGIDQDEGRPYDAFSPAEVEADLHFYNFLFCHSCNFAPEKTSCFLSIMKQVFTAVVDERLDHGGAFDLLKALLLRHSVPRPPWSVAVFSLNDLKVITDYVVNTFFRHYKLYQFVYVTHRQLELSTKPNRFQPPIPAPAGLSEQHTVEERAQEELAHHFDKVVATKHTVDDLTADLFKDLARTEANIAEEDRKVIALALERKCAQVLADFEQQLVKQDREFERNIQRL